MPDRRQFLCTAIGAATAAALPIAPLAEAVIPVAAPVPAWVVGTPGEMDWQFVTALTEREAKIAWLDDWGVFEEWCALSCPDERDCERCNRLNELETTRLPEFDGRQDITPGEWIRSGMDFCCSRCGDEGVYWDGYAVGDEAVHDGCMKLADWDIVDPEHAAELRAEIEDPAHG